jgi:[histone H3]-lysine36 N-dimethyltransferase SETMAR
MKHVATRLVPKNLKFLQKLSRMRVAEDMLERVNSNPKFMKRIVLVTRRGFTSFTIVNKLHTGVFQLNRNRKNQSLLKAKVMLTVFFDYRGVMHSEFSSGGQTVNKESYLSVIRRLREQTRRKRPDLWKENSDFALR